MRRLNKRTRKETAKLMLIGLRCEKCYWIRRSKYAGTLFCINKNSPGTKIGVYVMGITKMELPPHNICTYYYKSLVDKIGVID